jgi:hypothetical protein
MANQGQTGSGNPGDLTELEVTEEDARAALLQESRRFMQFALAGEVVFWVLLFTSGPDGALAPLSIAGYFCAWGAAVMGVSRGARAVGMNPGLRIVFYVLAFGMIVRLVPIAYFLGRSNQVAAPDTEALRRQRTVEQARQRAHERQQERQQSAALAASPSAAPATAPVVARTASSISAAPPAPGRQAVDPKARERVSKAIPRIRTVNNAFKDGERVRMNYGPLPDMPGLDMSQLVMPVARACGIFGLNYMVDDGQQYTALNDDELAKSGFSLDELHQLAMRNLRQLVKQAQPGLKLHRLPAADGPSEAIMITLDGDNEAALLLLDELWDKSLAKHIPNGVMAVAPARDMCVFIDMQSVTKGGLGDLQNVVLKVHERQGHSFPGLLHRKDGRWSEAGEVTGLKAPAAA